MLIRTYARVMSLVLLLAAVVGTAMLGWCLGDIFYHAALGLLFAYAGFATREAAVARAMIGGLGGLVIVIGAV